MITFLSIRDFQDFYREIRRNSLPAVLSRLRLTKLGAIRATWDRQEFPNKNWSAIKRILEFTNQLCTGDPKKEYTDYIAEKYLHALEPVSGLSIGSGRGFFEIEWASACTFKELVGIDISQKCVDAANARAREKNKPEVNFICGNMSDMSLPGDHYDIVFSHASLHHFQQMEKIVSNIKKTLKPGGLFLVDEYVGPRRMQYTEKQLLIANELLMSLPEKYRKRWGLNSIKKEVHRPGILRMLLSDPSEGVESDKIMPLVHEHFKTLEIALRGGTILSPLFHDIGHNFREDDPEANKIVENCIATERRLLENGEIGCDFVIGMFCKE
jgi:ubiquinone/menaquinone biosynthesis C-methylase UbiE